MITRDGYTKKAVWSAVVGFSMLMYCGCQSSAQIRAQQLRPLSNPCPKSIRVLSDATDARSKQTDKIGQITFSVFMIPAGVVVSEADVEKSVGTLLSDALKQSGFEVATVQKVNEADGPVLAVQMDSINNYLFSWLWPLGLTFGRSQLTPVVFDNTGKLVWRGKPCSAYGFCPSAIYMAGFDTSLKMEMSSILEQIVAQTQDPEFRKAVAGLNM